MYPLWQIVQSIVKPHNTLQKAYGLQTLHVWYMCEIVPAQSRLAAPSWDPTWRWENRSGLYLDATRWRISVNIISCRQMLQIEHLLYIFVYYDMHIKLSHMDSCSCSKLTGVRSHYRRLGFRPSIIWTWPEIIQMGVYNETLSIASNQIQFLLVINKIEVSEIWIAHLKYV